jgi:uncharacterized membrane protein
MPFCTQCGQQVGDQTRFCANCGAAQPVASGQSAFRPAAQPQARGGPGFWDRIDAYTASILCYVPVLGSLPCIAVLASQRFERDRVTRFHAFQGLYIFVAWLVMTRAIFPFLHVVPTFMPIFPLEKILKLLLYAAWIVMLVKTSQRQSYSLPLFGELAERSLAEQR